MAAVAGWLAGSPVAAYHERVKKRQVKIEKEEELDNGGGGGDDDGGSGGAGQPSRPRRRGQRHCSSSFASFDIFTENYATAIDATVVSSAFFGSLQNRSIAAPFPFRRVFVTRLGVPSRMCDVRSRECTSEIRRKEGSCYLMILHESY